MWLKHMSPFSFVSLVKEMLTVGVSVCVTPRILSSNRTGLELTTRVLWLIYSCTAVCIAFLTPQYSAPQHTLSFLSREGSAVRFLTIWSLWNFEI